MPRRAPVLAAASLIALGLSCAGHAPAAAPPGEAPAPPGQTAVSTAATASAPALPQRLSDQEFWSLVSELSEPDGYFRSDNLLSNEIWLQYVIPELQRTAKPGRVYLGVGPEQNFTYIAAVKPAMVFIVDVRRGNLDLHLFYKALFELSTDRVDFVSRLFARRRPPALAADADVNAIFEAVNAETPEEAVFTQDLAAVLRHLTKARHLPLEDEDVAGIQYVYRAFQMFGPGLTYWATGRGGGRFGRTSPTYWDLMMLTDESHVMWSYLANDANFLFLKQLEERNLLVPVVGNFAGPKALRAVGTYLKGRHAVVSAFYLSNVEQYLNMDGLWPDFCANAATLPLDETSTFIRAVRSDQYSYGPGGLTNVLGNMLEDTRQCGRN